MSETLAPAQKNEKQPEKVPAASTNVFAVYGDNLIAGAYAR